jgi:hypothetical protein
MAIRLFWLLAAAVLPLLTATASAGEPEKKPVTKLFSVVDLVTPIPDFDLEPMHSTATVAQRPKKLVTTVESGEQLVKLVTSMVRPYSWNVVGGAGKAEFFDIGSTLVVTNTPEVIAEVADLLEAFRRLQDISVSTEVRVLKVPAGFCERVGVKWKGGSNLTDREVRLLMEAVQGHREANVMQFPKVTTFDGQEATIRAAERRVFVTSAEVVKVKGQAMLVPKNTEVDLGDTLTLRGTASADRKFVTLRVNMSRTTLVGDVELVPVTMTIKPVFEGGSQGQPIPFTQFLQVPDLKTQTIEKSVVVPTGETVILGGWNESGVATPMMSKIPYLNRLYKNVGTPDCEVIVLATTRVMQTAEAEAAPMPIGSIIAPRPVPVRVAPSQNR